jgi:hypothetical protein
MFRKTSPMSIGTWVLISFGTLSAALAAAQLASDHGHSPGNTSAKRPKDYFFRLTGKGAAVSSDCCRAAVAALDRALDDGPDKIYHDLAEVVR